MKQLREILYKANLVEVIGSTSVEISSVVFNSSQVEKGSVFVEVRGTLTNGHDYIQEAVEKGAAAVICEEFPKKVRQGVTYVRVKDSSVALSVMCSNFFDNPSQKIKLIGITG